MAFVGSSILRFTNAKRVVYSFSKRWLCIAQHHLDSIPHYDMKKLQVSYSRSSGPGGQNVNKVETKVEVRLLLSDVEVEYSAMERLRKLAVGRVNNDGELIITNSESRSRKTNYDNCIRKVTELIQRSLVEPKVWNKNSKTKTKFHAKRLHDKKMTSRRKAQRRERMD